MIIKLKKTVTEEVEVDVDFPVYGRHDMDGDGWSTTIFYRNDEDGTHYAIKEDHRSCEIEIMKWSKDNSSIDYVLGHGEYASNAEEFEKARQRAEAFFRRVPVST